MVTAITGLVESKIKREDKLKRIEAVFNQVNTFFEHLKSLHNAARKLHISVPGEPVGVELGVIIPAGIYKEHLGGLADELREFDRHFRALSELAQTQAPSPVVKAVTSSTLEVFLESAPSVAACLMLATERFVALYKNLIEIRKTRDEWNSREIPGTELPPAEEILPRVVSDELNNVQEELFERYGGKVHPDRENELQILISNALRYLFDRLDRGVQLECRLPEKDEQTANTDNSTDDIDLLFSNKDVLNRLPRAKLPILRLTNEEGDKATEAPPENDETA